MKVTASNEGDRSRVVVERFGGMMIHAIDVPADRHARTSALMHNATSVDVEAEMVDGRHRLVFEIHNEFGSTMTITLSSETDLLDMLAAKVCGNPVYLAAEADAERVLS
jgi:hypothetical protein